ncbi:unnamed protein product [Prunus armeniaca]
MSNLKRVLERQELEIKCRHVEEDYEADEEEEEMVVATCMLNESRQHHRRHGLNVDRHKQSRVQKYDAVGVFGLLLEQKLTTTLRMLAYGASAKQKISTRGSTFANLQLGTSEGLYKKLRLEWKNCLTAWQGDYGNRNGQKSIILEVVASFYTWVLHAFFGVAGSQNDLNVLGQSPVINDVLRCHSP